MNYSCRKAHCREVVGGMRSKLWEPVAPTFLSVRASSTDGNVGASTASLAIAFYNKLA